MSSFLKKVSARVAQFCDNMVDMMPSTSLERSAQAQVDFAKQQSDAIAHGMTHANIRPNLDDMQNRPKLPKRDI